MITFFLTTIWGIAYLIVGVGVGVLAARELYYNIEFINAPNNAGQDALLRDLVFFTVLRGFIFAGALWPLTVVVHVINRIAAQRFADQRRPPAYQPQRDTPE